MLLPKCTCCKKLLASSRVPWSILVHEDGRHEQMYEMWYFCPEDGRRVSNPDWVEVRESNEG